MCCSCKSKKFLCGIRRRCSAVELRIRQRWSTKKHVSLYVNGWDLKAAAPQSRNKSKLGQMTVFAISGCQHGRLEAVQHKQIWNPCSSAGSFTDKLGYYHNCRGTVGVFFSSQVVITKIWIFLLSRFWGSAARGRKIRKCFFCHKRAVLQQPCVHFWSVSVGDVVPPGIPSMASLTAMP